MVGGEEQKMVAIGQELRPAMSCVLTGFELGEANRGSAVGGDAPQRVAVVGFVDDDVPVRCRNFLQMTIGKEAYEFSVRGPEGKSGALGAFKSLSREIAEGLH